MSMNDRFSARLRQHLLETADERPAEGQLAEVLRGVAATGQQRGFVRRLPWLADRIGPFPAVAVRYALLVLALIAAMVAGIILAGGGASDRTVFEGTWIATDPADDSTESLVIGAGPTPEIRYADDLAAGFVCLDDPVKVFTAAGIGTIVNDRLEVAWPSGGSCGLRNAEMGDGSYRYDETTNTLIDGLGATWARARRDFVQPTRAPLAPEPTCVALSVDRTYTAPAGSVVVSATLPAGSALGWEGRPGEFGLVPSCAGQAGIGISGTTMTSVDGSACVPGGGLDVGTFEKAVARLNAQEDPAISEPMELTIGGHAAFRYDVSEGLRCGFGLWTFVILGEGETGSIYVIDVDGVPFSIEVNWTGGATQTRINEAHAIVESLQITRE